jgi:hypothetical protein
VNPGQEHDRASLVDLLDERNAEPLGDIDRARREAIVEGQQVRELQILHVREALRPEQVLRDVLRREAGPGELEEANSRRLRGRLRGSRAGGRQHGAGPCADGTLQEGPSLDHPCRPLLRLVPAKYPVGLQEFRDRLWSATSIQDKHGLDVKDATLIPQPSTTTG